MIVCYLQSFNEAMNALDLPKNDPKSLRLKPSVANHLQFSDIEGSYVAIDFRALSLPN